MSTQVGTTNSKGQFNFGRCRYFEAIFMKAKGVSIPFNNLQCYYSATKVLLADFLQFRYPQIKRNSIFPQFIHIISCQHANSTHHISVA